MYENFFTVEILIILNYIKHIKCSLNNCSDINHFFLPGITPLFLDPSLNDLLLFSHSVQRRQWHPTPVLLPGKSHGRRSLVDCSPWGREESDMTEWLPFHFSLSCIGEGNGNPLQCSCLENPRDAGAWWAAVYGVAQSRTRLKRLSSSSSSSHSVMSDSLWPRGL